jgi:hypothetical protein
MELLGLVLFGGAISTVLVKRSSLKGMNVHLTWLQAVKVVALRGLVAVLTGFLLGKGMSLGIEMGYVDMAELKKHPYIAIAVVLICGLASLIAFKHAVQYLTGREVDIPTMLKTAALELLYYGLFFLGLVVIVSVSMFAYAFFVA